MNKLFYFLGLIIPIPLFFDLYSLSFFLHEMSTSSKSPFPYNYFTGSQVFVFAPVPIGIITFGLVALLHVFSKKEKKIAIGAEELTLVLLLMFFTVLSVLNVGSVRTMMLLFPFWCMYFVIVLTKNMKAYEKICSAYVVSFLFFVLLHVLSTLYFSFNGIKASFFLFNSIFGMQLYQALVSYSAVLSYAACTLTVFAAYKRNYRQRIPIYFFVFIILFLLTLGQRKAVLLDIGILFLLFLSSQFVRAVCTLKINKKYAVILFLLPIILFCLLKFTGFSDRAVNWEVVKEQRAHHYIIFFNLIADADLSQVLFGHGGKWGGFSNMFLEIVVRLGFLGLLLYLISFLIGLVIVIKHIKNLFNINSHDNHFSIWIWFTILTVVLSNIFNMNLQLPYYTMNFTIIMMVFLYRTKPTSTQS